MQLLLAATLLAQNQGAIENRISAESAWFCRLWSYPARHVNSLWWGARAKKKIFEKKPAFTLRQRCLLAIHLTVHNINPLPSWSHPKHGTRQSFHWRMSRTLHWKSTDGPRPRIGRWSELLFSAPLPRWTVDVKWLGVGLEERQGKWRPPHSSHFWCSECHTPTKSGWGRMRVSHSFDRKLSCALTDFQDVDHNSTKADESQV